jgi:CheY-like chemotaxis protein
MKKKIIVCVQRDIKNTISWALKDLLVITPQYFDHTYQIEKLFDSDKNYCGIIIDSQIDGLSTIPFLKTIRDRSNIKILLIIPAETPKQELLKLIQDKMVDNVILRPFNANQIVEAVAKLCCIQRATEKPWYMYTKRE